jgi:acyl carrier protein
MPDTNEARIEDRIKQMIVERCFLDIPPEAITDSEVLIKRHDIDSLKLFEIVVGTEEEFGISVVGETFTVDHFRTVKDIAECVRLHLQEGP